MKEKLQSITEGTVLPISLVITLVGGVIWLTGINSKAETAASTSEQAVMMMRKLDQRLSRIEGFLERQENRNDE